MMLMMPGGLGAVGHNESRMMLMMRGVLGALCPERRRCFWTQRFLDDAASD